MKLICQTYEIQTTHRQLPEGWWYTYATPPIKSEKAGRAALRLARRHTDARYLRFRLVRKTTVKL